MSKKKNYKYSLIAKSNFRPRTKIVKTYSMINNEIVEIQLNLKLMKRATDTQNSSH